MKIMSVLNLSLESPQFDSIVIDPVKAFSQTKKLLEIGADYVDLGGRSSGSKTPMIDDEIEQERLASFFALNTKALRDKLSIDTWSAQTVLAFIDKVAVINYTSTEFPEYFLEQLAYQKTNLILSYLSAKNPYDLRRKSCTKFNISLVGEYFDKTLEMLDKKAVSVMAIDPNLGMWHPKVPDAEKPKIQEEIIEHIPFFKKLAPVLIVAPRLQGSLNLELSMRIIDHSVDYIRTHDIEKIQFLLQSRRPILR